MKKQHLKSMIAATLAAITIGGFQEIAAQNITGASTTNYVLKFTNTSGTTPTAGNSRIWDDGTKIGVGTTSPLVGFHSNVGVFRISDPASASRVFQISPNYGGLGEIPAGVLGLSAITSSGEGLSFIPTGGGQDGVKIATCVYNGSDWRSVWETKNISTSGNPSLYILKSGGTVGIQTTTPDAPLHVYNNNNSYSTTGHFEKYLSTTDFYARAVRGSAYGSSGSSNSYITGVFGEASGYCNNDYAFGVWGQAYNAKTNYGVYGETATDGCANSTNYAGYFNGNLGYTGTLVHVSDRKFKENIKNIENPLSIINALQPHTYTFKQNGEYASMRFSKAEQFGFIAQDLEKVLPQLVSENLHPAAFDKSGAKISDEVTYKGVDYVSLIPIMVAAMQEQQKQLKEKDVKLIELETKYEELLKKLDATGIVNPSGGTAAKLSQCAPNPFKEKTVIAYTVPSESSSATIYIYNLNGQQLKKYALSKGSGNIVINGDELIPGVYLYSLIIDNKEVSSKKMILTE